MHGVGSITLVNQPYWEKENSKFKPAVLHLKINLVFWHASVSQEPLDLRQDLGKVVGKTYSCSHCRSSIFSTVVFYKGREKCSTKLEIISDCSVRLFAFHLYIIWTIRTYINTNIYINTTSQRYLVNLKNIYFLS